jgi:AP endonuclease 2
MLDVMNPLGMFRDGIRAQQWTTKNLLPMSGKLIPEFDRRRNIRDMFSRKPSLLISSQSSSDLLSSDPTVNGDSPQIKSEASASAASAQLKEAPSALPAPVLPSVTSSPKVNPQPPKRGQKEASLPVAKRIKSASQSSNAAEISKGQKSLKGFFAPMVASSKPASQSGGLDGTGDSQDNTLLVAEKDETPDPPAEANAIESNTTASSPARSQQSNDDSFIDPIVSKESWGKLFVKPAAPKCEHEESCKTMLTKKTGANCGRSFWMCARPLGPSGNKEKRTQWRCATFIWASDWNGGVG